MRRNNSGVSASAHSPNIGYVIVAGDATNAPVHPGARFRRAFQFRYAPSERTGAAAPRATPGQAQRGQPPTPNLLRGILSYVLRHEKTARSEDRAVSSFSARFSL